MKYSDQSYNLRIELDTKDCELSEGEISKMEDDLPTLRRAIEDFPVSNLYITVVHHPRRNDYHMKMALALSGKTLFTGDRDDAVHPAYERCVRKLVHKVAAYKQRMSHDPEIAKQQEGTHQAVISLGEFDVERLTQAVHDGNYTDFSEALDVFAASLADRIGRWIERYPALESHLGVDLTISDIVEEVFLTAFDKFLDRPHQVPAGDWLESLIDVAVHALLESSEEELANISFVQSMREVESHVAAKQEESTEEHV